MKSLILTLALLLLSSFAQAEATNSLSNSAWIDANTVLISNSQYSDVAKRDCETSMQILSLMTNDKIVFRSTCTVSNNPKCMYYYCYELKAKVLVVDEHKAE